jgi:hypothetical protein
MKYFFRLMMAQLLALFSYMYNRLALVSPVMLFVELQFVLYTMVCPVILFVELQFVLYTMVCPVMLFVELQFCTLYYGIPGDVICRATVLYSILWYPR